ncbi:MAG: Rqc2 family fibronectin-binding protein [Planctomycetota bacterium]|jgi:predicted ribosome quality control (RQC) complex YloA/Tae2 family protein
MSYPRSWFPVLARDVEEALHGGRVAKIRSRREDEVILTFRTEGEKQHLLLSAHAQYPRFHFLENPPEAGPLTEFVRTLRKHLSGARLESVLTPQGERIVEIGLKASHGPLRLVAECFPGKPNVILVDGKGTIRAVMKRKRGKDRVLSQGMEYRAPANPLPPVEETEPPDLEGLHGRLEVEYRKKEEARILEGTARSVAREIRRLVRKEEKRKLNLSRDLASAGDPDHWRRQGELLKIHAGAVEKGTLEVAVPDIFEPEGPIRAIPLDPRLDLEGNMEAYFKKYRRAKNGRKRLGELIEVVAKRLEDLSGLAEELARAEEAGDGDAVSELFGRLRLGREDEPATKKKGKGEIRRPYRRFTSAEGFQIWVGRNDTENDRLTTREARGRDLWLHVAAGFGGSHVLVRLPREGECGTESLLDAANLAAFFSQARGKRVDVSYTQAKHVRKPRKAKSGLVTLAKRSVIRVEPDAARLTRLLGKPPTFR